MKKIDEYFVPWVKGIPMYISGHIELAWKKPELHRMMSNENPNPPSEKVLETIIKYAKMANRYPDQGLVVRGKIAQMNGLEGADNVMLGNGSSEVYDNIFRVFVAPGEEVIQHTPCFGIYKLRGTILGGKMVSVPMVYKNKQLLYDAPAILKAVTEKTKIIVIANPNNPTGNFMEAADFVRIAETGIPFIVDEAYVEYAGLGMSQVGLTKKYKNVIVTRTLSKAYGLAGMRFRLCDGRQGRDRTDLGRAAALERGHDPDVGGAGGSGRHRRPRLSSEIQQRRGGFHHRIAERCARPGGLPLEGQLHSLRLRRNRQDRQGHGGLRGTEGTDPAPGDRKVRERRLVPDHDRHQGRESHGHRSDPRVPDEEVSLVATRRTRATDARR